MNSSNQRNLKPLAILIAAAFPALAAATPSISANASYEIVEGLAPWDQSSPRYVNGGFIQESVSTPFNKVAAIISPNPYFNTDVSTSAYSDGGGHFGASITNRLELGPGYFLQKAQTQLILNDSITNASSAAQIVSFDINIDNLKFYFNSGMIDIGLTTPPTNSASFAARVLVNGNTIWSSSFTANPIENGLNWNQGGTEIGLSAAATGTLCQSFYDCSLSITNYHQTIGLGPLATGDSLSVSYIISLQTETNTYGGASSVYFDDPAALSGNPAAPLSASLHFAAAPVPEPETASMLAAGLVLLGSVAAKRRRNKR